MPEHNPFFTVEQEAARAANELADIKQTVKDLLAKLTHIEKRLAAIGPLPAKKLMPKASAAHQFEAGLEDVFKNLLEKFKADARTVETELGKYKKGQLADLAKYCGCTVTSKTNKKELTVMVMGKLRESKIMGSGLG